MESATSGRSMLQIYYNYDRYRKIYFDVTAFNGVILLCGMVLNNKAVFFIHQKQFLERQR